MLQATTRWKEKEVNEEVVQHLQEGLDVSPLVATLLAQRGFTSLEDATRFLHTKYDFHDPFLLQGMDMVVSRVNEAIEKEEKVVIYGDYDADGVTSTTVMLHALKQLGANVDYYIPNRFREGYGPNEAAFRKLKAEGTNLVITVDTGISGLHEAQIAKEIGLDLIITDHHEPGPTLPECLAIIHPKLKDSTYPFHELAGVGVAFKVATALLGKTPYDLLPFVAIGTVADLVPLEDENRLIVKEGIQRLRTFQNIGLQSLLERSKTEQSTMTEESIGFSIGPRINAVGRLGDADPAVELLLTTDLEEANSIADNIERANRERQEIVEFITREAIEEIESHDEWATQKVLIVAKEGWNAGVVGIVASKLVEKYYKPIIILCIDREKGTAKGSARSIEGFDMFYHLSQNRDILPHFGGHPMAAGMTLLIENVNLLRQALNKQADETMTEEDFVPLTHIDCTSELKEISLESIEELQLLAPYGVGNPKPKFLIRNVYPQGIRLIGQEQNHLKLAFEQDGLVLDGIAFGKARWANQLETHSKSAVVGEVSINEWNGVRKPQLMIQDIAALEPQVFDLRTRSSLSAFLTRPLPSHLVVVRFHEQTNVPDALLKFPVVNGNDLEKDKTKQHTNCALLLLDLPSSEEQLQKCLRVYESTTIYVACQYDAALLFEEIPTREQFSWIYRALSKVKEMEGNQFLQAVYQKTKWSKESVAFMVKVFSELGFLKKEKNVIIFVPNPPRRDLSESLLYQQQFQTKKLEKVLILSRYEELKHYFITLINDPHEEEL